MSCNNKRRFYYPKYPFRGGHCNWTVLTLKTLWALSGSQITWSFEITAGGWPENLGVHEVILASISVRPKPLFWSSQNHILKEEIYPCGNFFIIIGPLKSILLLNMKDFQIIFVDLCSISSFSKYYIPPRSGKTWEKLKKWGKIKKNQ